MVSFLKREYLTIIMGMIIAFGWHGIYLSVIFFYGVIGLYCMNTNMVEYEKLEEEGELDSEEVLVSCLFDLFLWPFGDNPTVFAGISTFVTKLTDAFNFSKY